MGKGRGRDGKEINERGVIEGWRQCYQTCRSVAGSCQSLRALALGGSEGVVAAVTVVVMVVVVEAVIVH
ncbi:hypothetical protein E2C01_101817 [Portunus trituberculatus]|uniref:Uncharacterized protein n=1 Tax=Portunus trituberculatus TaxID=210409 RepID=A0A5B7KL00_PORTR|nr:hypothetical protein [Portunus trituberculatus]